MTVLDKLEQSLAQYLEKHPEYPQLVYLGEQECMALDKRFGGIVQDVLNCEIVMVMKNRWISWGDR